MIHRILASFSRLIWAFGVACATPFSSMPDDTQHFSVTSSGIEGAILSLPQGAIHWNYPTIGVLSRADQNAFGISADRFWRPDERDIQLLETELGPALQRAQINPTLLDPGAVTNPEVARTLSLHLEKILHRYDQYRRQYVGIVIDGCRHILVNSFPKSEHYAPNNGLITVHDGGSGFWRILYSVEEKRFLRIDVNGTA